MSVRIPLPKMQLLTMLQTGDDASLFMERVYYGWARKQNTGGGRTRADNI
jgi:hypothetical protein